MDDCLHHLLRRDALIERAADVATQLALFALRHQRGDRQQAPGLEVDVRALTAPGVAEAEVDQFTLDVLGSGVTLARALHPDRPSRRGAL